jgi:hypothetical protein
MADFELEDKHGNRYRMRQGAGPTFWHPEKIGTEAQHAIGITNVAGTAAFELILTIIVAAVTGGVGAVAAIGSKAHLIKKFQKVGDLLSDFAKATRKLKLQGKKRKAKGKTAKYTDLDADQVHDKKTDPHGAEDGKPSDKKDDGHDEKKIHKTLKPTPEEIELAKSKGTTPQHIEAREKVSRYFLENNNFNDNQISDAIGDYRIGAKGGVDMTKPLEIVNFPPPDTMYQHVRSHGNPGNWFDPIGGQTPDSLGISGEGRHAAAFNVPPGSGLKSTSRPILDKWTNKNNPVQTEGGGIQLLVNDIIKSGSQGI